MVTGSYVGSKGTHLTQQRNLNQLLSVPASANPYKVGEAIGGSGHDDCGTAKTPSGVSITGQALTNLGVACGNDPNPSRPLRGYGDITRLEDQANSIYHAFQATARRTVGDLTLSFAYTYSHSIDNSSDRFDGAFVDSYNIARNRGSSSFDVRHNLAISYVYALPFYKGSGLAHTVLGGWQVSGITIAQTGMPFSVTNGTDFGDNAGVANGVLNFDFGLFKRFSFGETKAIDFRWENFNLFNHTQYDEISGAGPGGNAAMDCTGAKNSAGDPACIASSSFLHASNAHLGRRMQFGLRFQF